MPNKGSGVPGYPSGARLSQPCSRMTVAHPAFGPAQVGLSLSPREDGGAAHKAAYGRSSECASISDFYHKTGYIPKQDINVLAVPAIPQILSLCIN